jgi:ABC-type Na+ efflux pump permease subunit
MEFMDTNRNKKIEEILSSLDGSKRAEVPDFFYTRLKAKMLARHEGGEIIQGRSRILRPVFIVSAILLVLAINAFVFLKSREETTTTTIADNNESIQQSIAAEYSLNDNNTVYDLNPDK